MPAYLIHGRFMGMKILRVYIDTSVIGGCFDAEFSPWSNGLMQDFRRGYFRPVLSEVVAVEIRPAPEPVRVQYAELLSLGAELLAVNDEALDLAVVYEARSILAPRFRNDLLHIALATVADVDVLVSWNFRHVVRLEKIRLFNAVNLERGYKPIEIYSPREVTTYDPDDHQSS
jgi:predicted nucleic acid-binding protein